MITPQDTISAWGQFTCDRWRAQARLMNLGADLVVAHSISDYDGKQVRSKCLYTEREKEFSADALVLVTSRSPNDALYLDLTKTLDSNADRQRPTLTKIGDCDAPAIIAAAVYSGHKYARQLEEVIDRDNPLKHDRVFFEDA